MRKIIVSAGCFTLALVLSSLGYAEPATNQTVAAAPTNCISTQFSASGTQYWKTISLQIKNQCSQPVNLQNATLTFKSTASLYTNFWGNFSPLSYPDNNLVIYSQKQPDGRYLASLNLHFPEQYSSTILPVGGAFQITYGTSKDTHIDGTATIYLQGGSAGDTGILKVTNLSASPANINQTYAVVHVALNGQNIKDLEVPWSSFTQVTGLTTGAYILAPENILDNAGNVFQGSVTPSTVTISKNVTTEAKLNYTQVQKFGQIIVNIPAIPEMLSGYATNPTITLTQQSGATSTQSVEWNRATTLSNLTNNSSYTLSAPAIDFNGVHCIANFNPKTMVAQTNASSTSATYQCTQVKQNEVSISVQGLPSTQTSLAVVLKPLDNSTPISQIIALNNGAGSGTFTVTEGGIYTIEPQSISGHQANISPQPFTASAGGTATISFAKSNTVGRVIGFLPGWKTPPPAQELANAGYTHIMVAFGVFSTSTPGAIVSAFDTVTADYIKSLHQANIKVLLSLGGALTSIPNTTVNFDQVVKASSSSTAFKATFINSLQSLMTQYGFDGFDIDIEHGLIPSGTFDAPTGDIAILADIINTMYQQNKNMLITLTPQVANISANGGFNETWGNYASLINRTYSSLAWVGIQLYNTGCAYGLDQICYSQTETANPDFSVAMAADLLENWPATLPNGRATGFQPYISHLTPSQVVIGYPAPNASGASDGQAAIPTVTIKRALQCLQTRTTGPKGCNTYISPRAYGQIGGVFNWEVTYDQDNGYKFAKDLKNCAINGVCN